MIEEALSKLRAWLLATRPSGPEGFEGLVRVCLEALADVPLRLARSGSQFGRDGSSSPDAAFGIAMEAKRHRESPRLEDIAGKAMVGGFALQGHVELWVLGVTAEVGDDVVFQASRLLEEQGMSLLVLDWAAHGLPRLATLLATDPDATIAWWSALPESPIATDIAAVLHTIREHPDFDALSSAIRDECQASLVGLGSLHRAATTWLKLRLTSLAESKQSFGQYLNVRAHELPVLDRVAVRALLSEAITSGIETNLERLAGGAPAVIAVLGDEGTGKSWLVAQWWDSLSEPPILLFVSGRRLRRLADEVDPRPLRFIATLLAEQDGRDDSSRIEQWYRRLRRWARAGPSTSLRFVIVLDGLNEHPSLPWADLVAAFAVTSRDLSGLLVVTVRPTFWHSQVLRRLHGAAVIHAVKVEDYSDAEVQELLSGARIAPATLTTPLRQFLRTPRVASVALRLLQHLAVDSLELTRERLLVAYWQHREEERGNLVAHSANEFARLLASHAGAWRARQQPFALDDWATHSGVARREGVERVLSDLSEIAEGRFLTPVPGRPQQYTFRKDVVPFALGTLLVEELRAIMDANPAWDVAALQQSVEDGIAPVRGFDSLAEIVVAAIGLACLDPAFERRGRFALVRTWLDLQNVGDDAASLLAHYVPCDPSLFLDLIEEQDEGRVDFQHLNALLRLVLAVRDQPAVAADVAARVDDWLRRWSVPGERLGDDVRTATWQAERAAGREESIAQLTATERAEFERISQPVRRSGVAHLTRAAAILAAKQPLAPFADAIAVWAINSIVAPDALSAWDDLRWIVLLNDRDPEAFRDALAFTLQQVMPDEATASVPMRRAVAMTLRISGDMHHAAWAERLDPLPAEFRWRRVEEYSETDPFDPEAPRGERVDSAVTIVDRLPRAALWAAGGITLEDLTLEEALPALTRFEPSVIVRVLRDVIQSAPTRDWVALLALSRELTWLSPLIDPLTGEALLVAFSSVVSGAVCPLEADRPDQRAQIAWVAAQCARAAMQHLEPIDQLALLQRMPAGAPLFLDLRDFLKPISAALLESALLGGGQEAQRWVLFAAGARQVSVTDGVRAHLLKTLSEPSRESVVLAAQVIRAAGDEVLDRALLALAAAPGSLLQPFSDDDHLTTAVAEVVRRNPTPEHLACLRPDVLPHMTDLSPHGVSAFDAVIDAIFLSFHPAAMSRNPHGETVVVGGARHSREDAVRAILEIPSAEALAGYVRRHPGSAIEWCRAVAEQASPEFWLRVTPFAVTLASAIARLDGALAATLIRRGLIEPYFARVTINGVDVLHRACFADSPDLWEVQESLLMGCLTDAELEGLLRAAEAAGATGRLDHLVDTWTQSRVPGYVARALTISGLRMATCDGCSALDTERVLGSLGTIAAFAARQAQRHRWMTTWLERAAKADDPIDVWRFGTLAANLADSRFRRSWALFASPSPAFTRYATMLWERSIS